jgi:hypothetical protein
MEQILQESTVFILSMAIATQSQTDWFCSVHAVKQSMRRGVRWVRRMLGGWSLRLAMVRSRISYPAPLITFPASAGLESLKGGRSPVSTTLTA